MGRGYRWPAEFAAWFTPVVFLIIGLWMLQRKHALFWQLSHWWNNDIYEPQYRLERDRKPGGLGYLVHRMKVGVKRYLFSTR